MILYATIAVGCEECHEQTNVVYIGTDIEKAREPLKEWVKENPGRAPRLSKIEQGPRYPDGAIGETTCIEYFGYLELHRLEINEHSPDTVESAIDASREASRGAYGARTGREGS